MGESIGHKCYTVKRRHKHGCSLCGHPLLPGQSAERWLWKDCNDIGAVVVHAACNAKAVELGVYDQDDGTFYPDSLAEAMRDSGYSDGAPCPCGREVPVQAK